ncbi:MAG: TIGR03089 family protein [Actinophytocola sp.]|uniref:TIGR03089 family protein n=1 Tax=Actinophytocola sp. TaxID=1872138 RepID=UPI0013290E11|nr:TIGR03089 family protein [Actinophytocola sp.]MPZ84058.1 TIGR03089 family protein [Actinophytocola sp.]
MSLTETLLRPYAGSPARPMVTHYDDAAGTRVELSVASLRNWAAKTANWLVEEHDVEPGSRVATLLPAHWQTAGVLLGAWWCGANVVTDPLDAAVAFVPPSGSAVGARTVAAVSLDPMGMDLRGNVPAGMVDYIAEARVHGDDFLALTPVPGAVRCLDGSTVDEVLEVARQRAGTKDLTSSSRVMSTVEWTTAEGIMDGLLSVLAAGASLVQVTNPDADLLAKHASTERSTFNQFDPGPALPPADEGDAPG